jgi:hypothetical protein
LQIQACTASSSSEIEDGTAFDARQEFPIPPLPSLEAPEEPFGMHGRSDPVITFYFQGQLRYLLAVQVVEQSSPESVGRGMSTAPILVGRSSL